MTAHHTLEVRTLHTGFFAKSSERFMKLVWFTRLNEQDDPPQAVAKAQNKYRSGACRISFETKEFGYRKV